MSGLSVKAFRGRCRVSYSKVVEFQARGLIHVHVPIRLDGPEGPDGPACDLPLSTADLEDAVRAAAESVRLDVGPLSDGTVYRLGWGSQLDCRSITDAAGRDSGRGGRVVHPEQVAAYLAKYLTKATEDFGLPERVRSPIHARAVGASPHAVRIIEAANRLAGEGGEYARLVHNFATLGYRGHPITKSRSYSVTFGQIRRARRAFRRDPGLAPDADIREVLDDDADVPGRVRAGLVLGLRRPGLPRSGPGGLGGVVGHERAAAARQPLVRGVPIASQTRSPGWSSRAERSGVTA